VSPVQFGFDFRDLLVPQWIEQHGHHSRQGQGGRENAEHQANAVDGLVCLYLVGDESEQGQNNSGQSGAHGQA